MSNAILVFFTSLFVVSAVNAQSVSLTNSSQGTGRVVYSLTGIEMRVNAGEQIGRQPSPMDKSRVMDFFQNQQFEEAIAYMEPALAFDSNNVQLLGYLGYSYYMTDNVEAAEKYFQRIFSLDSNNVSALGYLVRINNFKSPEKAEVYALRLVGLQPNKASHWRNMADLLHRTNQGDSALVYYNKAYALAPDDYRNAGGLSEILIEKNDFSRADSILEKGLANDSLNLTLLKLRIRSSYNAKEYEHALLPGERLMRLEETSVSPLTQVALSYYSLKKYADCIRVCEYMLNKGLEIESIYYYEAKACSKLKQYAKSNELYETALAKAISNTAELYYYNLAENYEALKQYSKAIPQYDTAFFLFKNPVMNYNAGRIYESELKNEKLARKYYLLYLQTARPKTAEEKKAYEYVKEKWGRKNTPPANGGGKRKAE